MASLVDKILGKSKRIEFTPEEKALISEKRRANKLAFTLAYEDIKHERKLEEMRKSPGTGKAGKTMELLRKAGESGERLGSMFDIGLAPPPASQKSKGKQHNKPRKDVNNIFEW